MALFGRQQAAAARFLRLDGLFGHGPLRLAQALLVDQGLQVLDFLSWRVVFSSSRSCWLPLRSCSRLLPASSWRRRAISAVSEAASALSWLRFGQGLATCHCRDRFSGCCRSAGCVWLLLISAWPVPGGSVRQCFDCWQWPGLFATHLVAVRSASICSSCALIYPALCHRNRRAGLEPGQFALVFAGLARGIIELLLDVVQALFVISFAFQQGQVH